MKRAPIRGVGGADRDGAGCRYRFFGGKGGAGKTTCAAAAGLAAAEQGRHVLVVSTDPAHSLGDVLARRVGRRATRISTARGELYAAELDADRALDRWLTSRRPVLQAIAGRGTYLGEEDIERFLHLSFPGVDELIGLVELTRLAQARRYDEVVVDTAPTGHTLRLLAMPETLQRLASVLDHMQAKHRYLAERFGGRHRPDAGDALIAEIEAEARHLQGMLRDPRRSTFSWVLLPETLAVEETADGVRELDRSGMHVGELIVNRVTPPPGRPCRLCDAKIRTERTAIRSIQARFAGRPLRFLAGQLREPRGVAALRPLGARLRASSRGEELLRETPRRAPARTAVQPSRIGGRAAWLKVLAPRGVRMLVFAGKGGVGKTTCAATAALALAEAAPHRKILLLSTDPAHSLADVLEVPLGDDERPVAGASSGLRVRELDAERTFRLRRDRYRAAIEELFDSRRQDPAADVTFDRAVAQGLMDLAPPGIDELFSLVAVSEALFPSPGARPAYETVVLDSAPTGHTIRLLALPGAARQWIRALLAILLKYQKVMGLGQFAEDLVGMSRSLRHLESLLRDPQKTAVVVVTRPAELPRRETVRLVHHLSELGFPVAALFVNAVTPPGCPRCTQAAAVEGREIEVLRAAAAKHTPAVCEVLVAPMLAPPPRGVPALHRWGRTWERISTA